MARISRFLCPELPDTGRFELPGEEAAHAIRVLRLREGAQLIAFDGRGRAARARVVIRERRRLVAEVVLNEPAQPAPRPALSLFVAPPKGKRMAWLVEKATELGVSRIVPLLTARGEVDDRAISRERPSWHRKAIEACKQSRRNTVPVIGEPVTVDAQIAAKPSAELGIIAHPHDSVSFPEVLERARLATAVSIAIGPEGGFCDEEVAAFREAGWMCVSLGSGILRIETAALAVIAALRLGCDRQNKESVPSENPSGKGKARP